MFSPIVVVLVEVLFLPMSICAKFSLCLFPVYCKCGRQSPEGKGSCGFFTAKRRYRRGGEDLIRSAIPSHDAQVSLLLLGSNPFCLAVLAAKSDY